MITLYTFGPSFGLPDPSPFVCKTLIQLKMAGLAFKTDSRFGKFRSAPKGKLPYIEDDGVVVSDSFFIRRHIETKYGFDFDAGYELPARGIGVAVEKTLEESFYWAMVHNRWIEPQNWVVCKEAFFAKMPFPLRYIIPGVAQRKVLRNLAGQGMGRHSTEEIRQIALAQMTAISHILGDRPYLLGPRVSGADATLLAFVMAATTPAFTSPLIDGVNALANLIAYRDRLRPVFFG